MTPITVTNEDLARLELIPDHDGNDLSDNDKALLTRLIAWQGGQVASCPACQSKLSLAPTKDKGER